MADRTARSRDWFQIVSNVAIIIGLGLVIYELNQSKQLAKAQFTIDNVARMTGIQLAVMSEDPREALAKAALHPADLDERDVVALDAYYEATLLNWMGLRRVSQHVGADTAWRESVAGSVRTSFSSEPGRRWLRAWAADADDPFGRNDVAEIAEETLQVDSGNGYRARLELLLAND